MNLLVEIDGETVPLSKCDWVQFDACGCPRSMCYAADAGEILATEDAAWRNFYPNLREVAAAKKLGRHVELVGGKRRDAAFDAFRQVIRTGCPHKKEAAA